MSRVPVNPELFRLARERAGVVQKDQTAKFKRLHNWEDGHSSPTLEQRETLFHTRHVLDGLFFFQNHRRTQYPFRTLVPSPGT